MGFCKHRAVRIPDQDTIGVLWKPAARRSDVLSGLGVILVELQLCFRSSNERALTDGDGRNKRTKHEHNDQCAGPARRLEKSTHDATVPFWFLIGNASAGPGASRCAGIPGARRPLPTKLCQ